jgi:hypothetical protein
MLSITTQDLSSYTINIDINQQHDFVPKSESIHKYINSEIERVIQESLATNQDQENISFKPNKDFVIRPFFNDSSTYQAAGLTGSTLKNNYTDESFYIFDIFDNYSNTNQQLLSRNFIKLTKVFSLTTTDINFYFKKIVKEYTNIYIPSYFIDITDTFYLKISFFNASTGDFRFFECSKTETDALKDYFKIKIDKVKKTFEILNGDVVAINSNIYKITQVIETAKEQKLINTNRISKLRTITNNKKIITSRGKII